MGCWPSAPGRWTPPTGKSAAGNTEVRVDDAGKIHLTGMKAVEEPPSLIELRSRTAAMLPRFDLPEAILSSAPSAWS
jgi:hypothetical protein